MDDLTTRELIALMIGDARLICDNGVDKIMVRRGIFDALLKKFNAGDKMELSVKHDKQDETESAEKFRNGE